jgi:hypothetical protein
MIHLIRRWRTKKWERPSNINARKPVDYQPVRFELRFTRTHRAGPNVMAIRATFIGINKHQDPSIPELNGARRDATALWALFTDTIDGLRAQLLVDEGATHASVSAAMFGSFPFGCASLRVCSLANPRKPWITRDSNIRRSSTQ